MFNRKTALVLGAGTSFEIGFPLGSGLRDQMVALLNINFDVWKQTTGDRVIVEALRDHCSTADGRRGDINPFLQAGRKIRDGMPLAISIANFLEAHVGDEAIELMGKLGIARAILKADASSPLLINQDRPTIDVQTVAPTWYGGLARALTEGVPKKSLDSIFENLSIITFNYDRSVEQFLVHALSTYYQEPVERMKALVAEARIYHPYGMVGRLPWQDPGGLGVPFGGGGSLLPIAAQIKTFTESLGGEAPIEGIHAALCEAEQVIFLGFAYHRQNIQLLTPPNGVPAGIKRLYGTAFGVSHSDLEVISTDVANMFRYQATGGAFTHHNLRTEAMSCAEFMTAYHRSITG